MKRTPAPITTPVTGRTDPEPREAPRATPPPARSIAFLEIVLIYDANEVRGDASYKDVLLIFEAYIDSIGRSVDGELHLTLDAFKLDRSFAAQAFFSRTERGDSRI